MCKILIFVFSLLLSVSYFSFGQANGIEYAFSESVTTELKNFLQKKPSQNYYLLLSSEGKDYSIEINRIEPGYQPTDSLLNKTNRFVLLDGNAIPILHFTDMVFLNAGKGYMGRQKRVLVLTHGYVIKFDNNGKLVN